MRLAGQAYTVKGKAAQTADYDVAIRKVLAMLGEVPSGHVAVYACEHDLSAIVEDGKVLAVPVRVAGSDVESLPLHDAADVDEWARRVRSGHLRHPGE